MKENQNSIAYACDVLAEVIKSTPEISGLFGGESLCVYSETDENFEEKLEATLQSNLGAAVFVRNSGWTQATMHGDAVVVSASFSVRVVASILLNSEDSRSLTDLVCAITKAASRSLGDERFLSPFVPSSMSVFESSGSITRELTFTASLVL